MKFRNENTMLTEKTEGTRQLRSLLSTIRNINKLIIRERETDRFLQGICDNFVESREFSYAWIALPDNSGAPVSFAVAGPGEECLAIKEILKSGELPSCGKKALAQSEIVVIEDPSPTCAGCPVAEKVVDNVAVIVRLESHGNVFGVLALSIPKDKFIEKEEPALLKEIADDIAFALHAMETEKKRKAAEESLRQSKEKYRLLAENTSDVIWVTDMDLRFTYISPSVESHIDYTPEEMMSLTIDRILTPGSLEVAYRAFEEEKDIEASGLQYPFRTRLLELELIRKDGSTAWTEVKMSPVRDPEGRWSSIQGVARDITERKQAEKRIKKHSEKLERMVKERTSEIRRSLYDTEEARDRMDGILKSVADGLIVTDIYNRIILMNRAAEDLLGVRFSEVIDRPIEVALHDETLRELLKTTLERRGTGHQFDYELQGEDPEHPGILRARTSIIEGKDSKYSGVIIILSDVTLERELDRMKSEFISMAAHELRNPLTSIMGYSELLMIRDDIKEEERKKYISNINKQSVILAEIINDLLDVSRIESGKGFTLNKVPSDMFHIIREVTSSFQLQTDKHTFDIILPEEPVEVMLDREKMEQVLGNILSNAVKYSPEGGAIRLSAKKLLDFGIGDSEPEEDEKESAFRALHSALEISIADQGIGMTPDQVQKIFDKFYRADTSNTTISDRKSVV